eukprot:CAMPEP_0194043410 /NCGR_PEP_ID=MMETSP0009_2-20130614/15043_1 /TAXON_ID=210454 /ORGANISM="Grammatophora oceanica, Strain CCMP 410" /LENGTH=2015 /DNA_ID=CAMNT_0038687603 /DNA_START=1 /DNA_END=6048 /DNA_ORIENTATION=+
MKGKNTGIVWIVCIGWSTAYVRAQAEGTSCAVYGAAYGNMYEQSPVQQWAPLVGIACANSIPNTCYDDAVRWSSMALQHGNRPVNTAEECSNLCSEVEDCEVWTFWPSGMPDSPDGKLPPAPKCDMCPMSLGGSFNREQGFCNDGDCGLCWEPYDYTAAEGIPSDADYTCENAQGWFSNSIGCCEYDEQAREAYQLPATCELHGAALNNSNVLTYGLEAVTGPKDCSDTLWLPFLEPVHLGNKEFVEDVPTASPVVVDFQLKGYCDMCPPEYGYELLSTRKVCYEDGSCGICQDSYDAVKDGVVENNDCEGSAEWFIGYAGCCLAPEELTKPNLNQTDATPDPSTFPRASDGRLCWAEDSSYGSVADGACAEADIVGIYAYPETIELGFSQGWWKSPVTGKTVEPIPYESGVPYTVSDCHQACIDNPSCGGWQLQGGSCVLKSTLDCSPTIARSPTMHTTAGVSGCIDASSSDPMEKLAMDTSSFWFLDCNRPRCTEPYSFGGRWTGDTYVPDFKDQDACWYKQYTSEELFDGCVKDRWIVINGGSNSLSFFLQMLNLFAPLQRVGDPDPLVGFHGGVQLYPMIDVVFRPGSLPVLSRNSSGILHINQKRFCDVDPSLPCLKTSLHFPENKVDWPPAYGDALSAFLNEAPYEEGATRVTLVVGQFWGAAEETLRAVGAVPLENRWASANVLFYGQAMTWYACNIDGWCEHPLLGQTTDEMLAKYRADLGALLEVGDDVCDSDRFDCFFATQGYRLSPGRRGGAMIESLHEMTAPYDWAKIIDYNGFLHEGEVVGGHLTPAMFVPVFAMLWNTVCDGPAVGCPQAISTLPICWADCRQRREDDSFTCSDCHHDDWECYNEVQCDVDILDPVPWQLATSVVSYRSTGEDDGEGSSSSCFLADGVVDVRSGDDISQSVDDSATSDQQSDDCKNRVWCGTVAQGRAVGILLFLCGLGVLAYAQYQLIRTEKRKEEEKKDNQVGEPLEKGIRETVPVASVATSRSPSASSAEEDKNTFEKEEQLLKNHAQGSGRASSRHTLSTQGSSSAIEFVASVQDDAVIVSLPSTRSAAFDSSDGMQGKHRSAYTTVSDKEPLFSADQETSSVSSDMLNRIRSGPVCVDDFVDSSLVEGGANEECFKNMPPSAEAVDVENQTAPSSSINEAGKEFVPVPKVGSEKPKQAALPKDYLHSLGMARLFASVHIVLGHLYAKGVVANVYFFGWGYTWVPWFFMLSGYVLTHARLNSRDPTKVDGPYKHIAKRLSTIFPMYAFGVFLSMLIRILRDLKLPGYSVLIPQAFLMQSWVPLWTEEALLSHCWFLSNMVVYWAGFGIVYAWIRKLNLTSTCVFLAGISILPWLLVIVPAISDRIEADWYRDHSWGSTDSANDIWTIMLKFHPLFYAHVFLFGMLLSVLRHRVKNAGNNTGSTLTAFLSCCIRFGATLGYFGLILVFTIEGLKPSGYKLSARLSVLLPLQGLILLGLSPLPQLVASKSLIDPLASLFALGPTWIGDVSYCQYILQFIMYNLFPVAQITNASYFLYLLGASMLSYKFVQEPGAKAWKKCLPTKDEAGSVRFLPSLANARLIFLPPTVLALILIIAKASYNPSRKRVDSSAIGESGTGQAPINGTNYTNATNVPGVVIVSAESVDLKLNWTVSNTTKEEGDRLLINPSMLFRFDENGNLEWIRAARAHAIEEEIQEGLFEGQEVTEQFLRFSSSITLSREPFTGDLSAGFDAEGIISWGLGGIQSLSFIDTKLVSHVGKGSAWTDLCEPKPSFNRQKSWVVHKQVSGPEDPKLIDLSDSTSDSWGVTFSSFPPASLLSENSSPDECKWADEAVMQMYLAEGGALASGGEAHASKLQCGQPKGSEKNWIAFLYNDSLYYVYSIEPHVIVQVRAADGACSELHETSSSEMKKLSGRVSAVRGSATALRYSETEYLALLHTREPTVGYSTHAYTFDAKPPFAVKRISKKIPLQGGGRAFPSSLSLVYDKVIIGYGDSDKVARALVMSRTALEETFEWCSDGQ